MIHIHPFPARMAPEVALRGLENLPKDYIILDPMSGSGMVLGTAAKLGLLAYGYDLDPLACMISKVNGTRLDEIKVRNACEQLLMRCDEIRARDVCLPWIDTDVETGEFIDFWFAPKQKQQLRILSHLLVKEPFSTNTKLLDVLKVAVSRLIITKEPKASLARDTAHSRPHRTIKDNDFDVFRALPNSLDHVLKALRSNDIAANVKAYRGDARRMGRIGDHSIDSIVTSPPYLNAIDYMRGHRLSLVWWGFSLPLLRRLRSRSVGAEIAETKNIDLELTDFFSELPTDVDERKRKILRRYYRDLCRITDEAFRVLKPSRTATYVMGNSRINGHEIKNSELLIKAAQKSGFTVGSRSMREIPENRRYMPMVNSGNFSLSKRMRSEHIIVFEKSK